MTPKQYANAAQCHLKTISGGIDAAKGNVELAQAGTCGGTSLLADALDHGFDPVEISDYDDQVSLINDKLEKAYKLLKDAGHKQGRLSKQINQRFYDINPDVPQPRSGT